MKILISCVVAVLFVCAVKAFPAHDPSDDVETFSVPSSNGHGINPDNVRPNFDDFDGVIISDTNPGFFSYTPIFPSFNFDFFTRLQDMLRSFRDHTLSFGPSIEDNTDTKWITNLPDDGKRNMTSTVEIIDGHKVITNDTVISHRTEFGDAVISIRVVDIEPIVNENNSTDTIDATTQRTIQTNDKDNYSPEELDPSIKYNEVSNDHNMKVVTLKN